VRTSRVGSTCKRFEVEIPKIEFRPIDLNQPSSRDRLANIRAELDLVCLSPVASHHNADFGSAVPEMHLGIVWYTEDSLDVLSCVLVAHDGTEDYVWTYLKLQVVHRVHGGGMLIILTSYGVKGEY